MSCAGLALHHLAQRVDLLLCKHLGLVDARYGRSARAGARRLAAAGPPGRQRWCPRWWCAVCPAALSAASWSSWPAKARNLRVYRLAGADAGERAPHLREDLGEGGAVAEEAARLLQQRAGVAGDVAHGVGVPAFGSLGRGQRTGAWPPPTVWRDRERERSPNLSVALELAQLAGQIAQRSKPLICCCRLLICASRACLASSA